MAGIQKQRSLEEKMEQLGLYERDLIEHFIRSRGKGGQNVNKVSSCVYIKHIPSGIEVKCDKDRSQFANRFFARRILAEKYEKMILGKKSEAEKKRWKIAKQKKRRSRKAKEKMLADKRHQSEKKQMRIRVGNGE